MKKVRRFTIIELIVAMSLACIVSGLLFLTIRNLAFVHTRFAKQLPAAIHQEKAFHFLKNLTERILIDSKHPLDVKKEYTSFFYTPTAIDYDASVECYFAKIEVKNAQLFVTLAEKKGDQLTTIYEHTLLTKIDHFQIIEEKKPACLILSFTKDSRDFSWVFFLEPQFYLKEE